MALRISGVATKVGEKSVALKVGEKAASHLTSLQAPGCYGRSLLCWEGFGIKKNLGKPISLYNHIISFYNHFIVELFTAKWKEILYIM